MKLNQIIFSILFCCFTLSAVAQDNAGVKAEKDKDVYDTCEGQLTFLRNLCKTEQKVDDPKLLSKVVFEQCDTFTKVEVITGNISSSDSKSLGAHKLCKIVEYRPVLNGFREVKKDNNGKVELRVATTFYRGFNNMITKEYQSESSVESTFTVFAKDRSSIECITLHKTDEDETKCIRNNPSENLASRNRFLSSTPIEIPQEKDLDKIRMGAAVSEDVTKATFTKASPTPKAQKAKVVTDK